MSLSSARAAQVLREPAVLSVRIAGYDFAAEGGYAVLAAGGQQVRRPPECSPSEPALRGGMLPALICEASIDVWDVEPYPAHLAH
jgi:hypothetical protein